VVSGGSHIRENIESFAMRQVPEAVELEATLRRADMGPSLQTCDRRLPIAVFLRSSWQNLQPEFRANFKDFAGSNLELDWAFFDTPDLAINAQHMRDETSARRAMKSMLERHDPLMLQRLNLQVIKRLAERHGTSAPISSSTAPRSRPSSSRTSGSTRSTASTSAEAPEQPCTRTATGRRRGAASASIGWARSCSSSLT
jgi:hypothetical protein